MEHGDGGVQGWLNWRLGKVVTIASLAGALVLLCLLLPTAGAFAASDPHFAVGSPTPQVPLTTSAGVASEPWADPFCPPTEGTSYKDPGVPPKSWASLLPEALIGNLDQNEVAEVTLQAVADAWVQYLVLSGGVNPAGFLSLEVAQAVVRDRAIAVLLSQTTWESIIQRIGNVYKPTTADPVEFLAHLDQYANGVESAACDGNDGYRLFRSSGSSALWQLSPTGDWAKLVYDPGAPEPPAGARWAPVPGAPRTYVSTVSTGNPLNRYGIPLVRVTGELTISPDANVHSCATDESTTATVRSQLNADVYDAVQHYASWLSIVPPARFLALLPSFSESCATAPAVYTPWTSGPVVPLGSFAISDHATYIAGYTATSSAGTIDRWHRNGTEWDAGVAFARPTFNFGGDEVLPRLAISGDGETVAGCWLSGPVAGSGLESLQETQAAGLPSHFPEIFHFRDGSVSYPSTGTIDPQGCSAVSLNGNGETVWYQQRDLAPHWFSSPTAKQGALPLLSLPQSIEVEATGPDGATVSYSAGAHDSTGPVPVSCLPSSGGVFPLGMTSVRCSAANGSGTSAGTFPVIVRDTSPPELSVPTSPLVREATGPSGAEVVFDATARDSVDGDVPVNCSPASGTTFALGDSVVHCYAKDGSGNEAGRSFDVVVQDTTPPSISVSHMADGEGGWNVSSPVPVTVTASDAGSGLAASPDCTVDGTGVPVVPAGSGVWTFDVSGEGTHELSCSVSDVAGNRAGADETTKIDTVQPEISLVAPVDGGSYVLGSSLTASYDCSDETSGLASCMGSIADGGALDTSTVGPHAFVVKADDNAGNPRETSASYTVVYATAGLTGPVNGMPTVNTGKGGRTYPLKWQLKDVTGHYISSLSAISSISYKVAACSDFSTSTDALEVEASGGTSLRYDSTANQYIYNWASPGNGCYVLSVKLDSGQVLSAAFKLS